MFMIPYSGTFSLEKIFAEANCVVLWENFTRSIFALTSFGEIKFYKVRVQNGITYVVAVFELVTHSQRSEHVYHTVLPRKAYCSSQVSRGCVVYV